MTLSDSIKVSGGGPLCPEKCVIRIHGNILRQESGAPFLFDTFALAEAHLRTLGQEENDE